MAKVVILGIDGFDPVLLKKWKSILPNLNSIIDDNPSISADSTIPPDSICAWTSIFTGENPAEHGLIESIDYLSGRKGMDSSDKVTAFKGKTFWDAASKKGKKACVINPFLAYPAWKLNGMMVSGPVFEGGELSAYPEDVLSKYEFPPLGGIVDFPDERDLGKFVSSTTKTTQQLADVSLKIFKEQSSDLFFVTFLTLDRIKHFLWRYTDKADPYYKRGNAFENVIRDFYILFDNIIGKFKKLLDKDSVLIIISDHGHRRRCVYNLNLNELLRNKGYLVTRGRGAKRVLKRLIEKTKVFVISTLSKLDFQDYIYKIAKLVPNHKALKKSTYLVEREKSSAILSELCGANPHGGIDIKAQTGEEYEQIRDNIINELKSLDETLNENVVKWAKKREQIYRGEFEDRLPDVMFELDEKYGVGMDLFTPLVTPNHTHKKISGGHKNEGVFLVYSENKNVSAIKRPDSVIGVKNYILGIMGIL